MNSERESCLLAEIIREVFTEEVKFQEALKMGTIWISSVPNKETSQREGVLYVNYGDEHGQSTWGLDYGRS